jgi:anaerobic C4-dicarboxylate transporter DcuA
MISFWIQFVVFFACIIVGARLGGVGLGMMGAVGLVIFTFIFNLQPASPPIAVMLIIAAVITAASTLQAAGGLDFLVLLAEKILRKHPERVTFMGPIVTYFFTLFAGTGYVGFAIFPVIAEVAREAGVRPERPLSISVIASQQAITASPMSAATAAMVGILAPAGVTLGQIMLVCIPATLIGILVGAVSVYKKGKELVDDPEYQRRIADGELVKAEQMKEGAVVTKEAKRSVYLFTLIIVAVIVFGTFKSLLPSWEVDGATVTLSIPHVIEMMMLGFAGIIVISCKVRTGEIIKSSIFQAGMMGVVAVFGVAWMGDTFFTAHRELFITYLASLVQSAPWLYAVALFFLSALLFSQGATVRALMPFGMSLGLSVPALIGMFPAVNGYFFIPTSPPTLGAIAFDRTGTTTMGRYLFDHSFMRPGVISIIVSVSVGLLLANLII